MLKKWFNKETTSISAGAVILAFSSLTSRIIGILRDRILAGKFGAGDALDIYYASFQIPDFFYNIFILGTLSVAFIPIFTSYIKKNNEYTFSEEAMDFTNTIINATLIGMGTGCLLLMLFTPAFITYVAPGFTGEKRETAIDITRIILISPFIFSISSILSSILTSFKRFIAFSFSPILYNLGIIFGAYFFAPIWGVKGLAMGVVLGAFLHMLIQIAPVKNIGYVYKKIINLKLPGVKEFKRLFIPRIFGIDISQTSLLIGSIIGSTLSTGTITIFNLANNLQSMPIGLFSISLVSSAFPHLAEAYSQKDFNQFGEIFYKTASKILFFIIPSAIFLYVLRIPIIKFILATGKFTQKDVAITGAVLGCFYFSLFSQGMTPLILRCYYSMHDTITPFIINLISIAIDVTASYLFIKLLTPSTEFYLFSQKILNLTNYEDIRVMGLVLGFSLTSIIHMTMLYFILHLRVKNLYGKKLLISSLKFLFASIIAGFILNFLKHYLETLLPSQNILTLALILIASGIIGILIYTFISWILKVEEIISIKKWYLLKK
ncbi:murein biosynthesis integral membrane protein MurJ [Candidatus Desantisbacteria bacterium]|nr:murein biosynthesis integral membrane protein MurJ [Candidatus Desantisbacteria bacterium]